ncbi:MAG: hypothetical protein WCF36_04315 [Candidatus Nanopelagicales bacterium]
MAVRPLLANGPATAQGSTSSATSICSTCAGCSDWDGVLDLAGDLVLLLQPSAVLVEQRERRGSVRGVEGVEGLEDGGLAGLVLSDQAGHVVDVDLGRVEHVAKRLDVEGDQAQEQARLFVCSPNGV